MLQARESSSESYLRINQSINQYQHNDAPTIKSWRPPLYQVSCPIHSCIHQPTRGPSVHHENPTPAKKCPPPTRTLERVYHNTSNHRNIRKTEPDAYPQNKGYYHHVSSHNSQWFILAMLRDHSSTGINALIVRRNLPKRPHPDLATEARPPPPLSSPIDPKAASLTDSKIGHSHKRCSLE